MGYKVDFHIHSYYSDGTMKPTDLVRKYKDDEFDMIAITDHDGVDAIAEEKIAGEALKIGIVTGIEFSTEYDFNGKNISMHLLGYYFDHENKKLVERLKEIREEREKRNEKLLKIFNEMGYDIFYDDLLLRPGQNYVGKPNFALAFAKKGYVKEPKDAFEDGKFLESEEAKSVKKEKINVLEAMELLKEAGGIPVLAHPMKIKGIGEKGTKEFFDNLDALLRQLKKHGLKGLEVFHPSAEHEDALKLADLASKYHLHITEGSDFHGKEFE